jgi:hypothetical protein
MVVVLSGSYARLGRMDLYARGVELAEAGHAVTIALDGDSFSVYYIEPGPLSRDRENGPLFFDENPLTRAMANIAFPIVCDKGDAPWARYSGDVEGPLYG